MTSIELEKPEKPSGVAKRMLNLVPGGNPSGRPKGLMPYVRSITKDGKLLADTALSIATGELIVKETRYSEDGESYEVERSPSVGDRIKAIEWLADRGFGKAVETSVNLDVTTDSHALADIIARQLLACGVDVEKENKTPVIES